MPHPANHVGPLKVRHLTVELTDRLTNCQTGYLVILLENRQTVAAIISRLTLIGQVAVEAHFKMGNSNFIYEARRRALFCAARVEKFTPDAACNNIGWATVVSFSVAALFLRIV